MSAARLTPLLLAAAMFAPAAISARPAKAPAIPPAHSLSLDVQRRVDAGNVSFAITNIGTLARNVEFDGPFGLFYPPGTTNGVVFASGLWLGGKVGGAPRLAVAEYAAEFGPGAIVGGGPDAPGRPGYKVWKVVPPNDVTTDTAHVDRTPAELAARPELDALGHHGWTEYLSSAAPFGAPVRMWRIPDLVTPDPADSVDVPGPAAMGAQSTWCVFNDADPSLHVLDLGGTPPLGIEVRQTSWSLGFSRPGLEKVVFVNWRFFHRGSAPIDSFRVGLWVDPDLGGAADDLVGWEPGAQMAYAYNGSNADIVYGATAPAVGAMFLTAPGVGQPTAHSFLHYINGTDPQTPLHTWNLLNGLDRGGFAPVDPGTGQPARYEFSGDPVEGSGWLDSPPGDRRFLMTQQFGALAPGESAEVTFAFIVAAGSSRLGSVAELRCAANWLRQTWAAGFPLPAPTPPACVAVADCPRTASWWMSACAGDSYAPDTLAQLAAVIDERSTTLQWPNPTTGSCSTFAGAGDARADALREYATLLANVYAGRDRLQPHEGFPVRLGADVDVTGVIPDVTTLDELIQPASVLDAAVRGRYLDDAPAHVGPGLVGVEAGFSGFGGGAGAAIDFLGGIDPGVNPGAFTTVTVQFDRAHPRAAYRFLRLEQQNGAAPLIGRAYRFGGYVPTFLTAVESPSIGSPAGDTLALAFVERQVTDASGAPLGPEFQVATYDTTWMPDESGVGGREYLFVLKQSWTPGPNPAIAVDGAVLDGSLPWLYALWSRRANSDPGVLDDGDGFEFSFGIPLGPGADQLLYALAGRPLSDPGVALAYARLADGLAAINRGDRSARACDAPTAALASLVSALAQPGRVRLQWFVAAAAAVSVERRDVGGAWIARARLLPDGAGHVEWEDTDVESGGAYDYRLRVGGVTAGDVRVTVPGAFRLAFAGLRPNPAITDPRLEFTLGTRERATIEMFDLAGRRVWSRVLASPEPGVQVIPLSSDRLAPGVYLVRLSQGRERAGGKAVLIR